ncbi:MAG: hypothetical protein KY475_07185 [Planctomycetes bacterium]|nr:hypothetical protein [Planctomycetota bacterium]
MRTTLQRISGIALLMAAWVALGGSPLFAQQAQDDGKLATAVKQVADDVAAYLTENGGVQDFTMGAFASIPPGGVATLQVKEKLLQELETKNIQAKRRAKFSCTGEFRFNEVAKKVEILVNIHEGGIFRKSCTAPIFNVSDLAVLLGGTGQLATKPAERDKTFETSFTEPKPEVEASPPTKDPVVKPQPANKLVAAPPKSLVRADKTGQFGMEILRKGPDGVYEPVPVDDEDGFLFISLDIGDVYAIRLLNNTGRLAGATVTIDGLNIFTFSENPGYQRLGKIIVPPGSEGAIIKGWHKTNAASYSFKVADVGEAAVAEVKNGGDGALQIDDAVGIITATFCSAINTNDPQSRFPEDEPSTLALATARGPIVEQKLGEINAKFGVDREIISIRYDRLPPPPPAAE